MAQERNALGKVDKIPRRQRRARPGARARGGRRRAEGVPADRGLWASLLHEIVMFNLVMPLMLMHL